jgi:hypothetical protein
MADCLITVTIRIQENPNTRSASGFHIFLQSFETVPGKQTTVPTFHILFHSLLANHLIVRQRIE